MPICKNECVRLYQGPRKNDPKGYVCIACLFYLRKQGIRLREAGP